MTHRDNDDIANALHGLTSGEHVEPEPIEGSGTGQAHYVDMHGAPAPAQPQPAPPPPRPPAAPFRATPKPAPQGGTAPAPASTKPAVPPMRPRPQPNPQPPAGRPAMPTGIPAGAVRPPSPIQSPAVSRTALPPGAPPPGARAPNSGSPNFTPPAQPVPAPEETTDVQPVDEDDRVIVPAAPLSSLGPRPTHRATVRREPMFKTLGFRRTAIPLLLTTGTMLIAVAALRFLVNPDAILATMSIGTCLGLAAGGAVLLAVAVVNMAQVRQQLAAAKAGAPK